MFITMLLAAYYTLKFYYKSYLMLIREALLLSVYYRLPHSDSHTAASVFIKNIAPMTHRCVI